MCLYLKKKKKSFDILIFKTLENLFIKLCQSFADYQTIAKLPGDLTVDHASRNYFTKVASNIIHLKSWRPCKMQISDTISHLFHPNNLKVKDRNVSCQAFNKSPWHNKLESMKADSEIKLLLLIAKNRFNGYQQACTCELFVSGSGGK